MHSSGYVYSCLRWGMHTNWVAILNLCKWIQDNNIHVTMDGYWCPTHNGCVQWWHIHCPLHCTLCPEGHCIPLYIVSYLEHNVQWKDSDVQGTMKVIDVQGTMKVHCIALYIVSFLGHRYPSMDINIHPWTSMYLVHWCIPSIAHCVALYIVTCFGHQCTMEG